MRCPHATAVVDVLIAIVMTTRAGRKRGVAGIKLRVLVFRMTVSTSDPGSDVRLDHRRFKRGGLMTRSAT